jgi:phenylacetaldehyde dehydrogenase
LLAAKLKAGTVWINCYNVFDAALPSAVINNRVGPRMGEAVLENYTNKAVTIRL